MASRGCLWVLRNLFAIRSWIFLIIAFVAPCYLIAHCNTLEATCLYAICVMGILWLTEAIPITATALFPCFLFPMLGLATAKHVCSKYVNDTSMLFLGGLIVAVAIEDSGLHKRMALGIMKIVGATPNMLLLGLMVPTWFLSMWISNTATTAMMLPIIKAVVDQLKDSELGDDFDETVSNGNNRVVDKNDIKLKIDDITDVERKKRSSEIKRLSKVFALCVAYASNAGGVATLVGTPPNIILQGTANEKFDGAKKGEESGITFANWMGFAVPLSLIILFISWIWLQILFIRCGCCYADNKRRAKEIAKVIDKQFKELGGITFAEVMVLVIFVCLAILWIFRDLPDINGWSLAFKPKYVRDSTASLFMACLLFIMPKEVPNIFCWNKISLITGDYEKPTYKPILTWNKTVQKVPWGVILLLGGGFALADASQTSNLSLWLSCKLQFINQYEPWIINLIITCVVAAATEVTSNTATATLLLPLIFDLSIALKLHPLYMMISVCIACSFAFMLPVATPPNAIVFSTGYLKIYDMALAGVFMNIIGLAALALAINTWATPLFGLDTMPTIFQNMTSVTKNCTEICKI